MVVSDFKIENKGTGVHKYLLISGDVVIEREEQLFKVNIQQSHDPTNSAKKLREHIEWFNKVANDVTKNWVAEPLETFKF